MKRWTETNERDKAVKAKAREAVTLLKDCLPDENLLNALRTLSFGRGVEVYEVNLGKSIDINKLAARKVGNRWVIKDRKGPKGLLTVGSSSRRAYFTEGEFHAKDFESYVKLADRFRGKGFAAKLYVCRPLPLQALQVGRTFLWRRLVAGAEGCPQVGSKGDFVRILKTMLTSYREAFDLSEDS